jgi:phosphoglycolate phosphatase
MPRAVLWDWDNTLVDAWSGVQSALNAVFAEHGLPAWSREETLARVRGAMHESFPALFGERWREAAESFRAHHRAVQLAHVRPMPGVERVLDGFAGMQAVVSNKEGEPLRREVAHLGWGGRFAVVVGADDAAAAKPDPAPIWHALAAMGVKPTRAVWYVGDTGVDMLAAHAAGVTAVLLGDASHDGGVVELTKSLAKTGAQPHVIAATAEELDALLRKPVPGEDGL